VIHLTARYDSATAEDCMNTELPKKRRYNVFVKGEFHLSDVK